MCRSSVFAYSSKDAEQGIEYLISSTAYNGGNHRHGVLHEEGKGPVASPDYGVAARSIACAICIRETTSIRLTGIPPMLQKQYGLEPQAAAVFIPGDDEPDLTDKIMFLDGRRCDLYDFADLGIRLALTPIETVRDSPSASDEAATGQNAERAPVRELVDA